MRLQNTLTGAAEDLVPVTPGRIGLYVCGVTPYDSAHVGHAMSLMVYDVLVRYLRWRGLQVTFVSNYTDVDDKLIDRAAQQERDPLELADANIEQWEREQVALGLLLPDVRPRVTREIDNIIGMIEEIVANGLAYVTPAGDVYYRVRSKADYGKLSHRNIDDLRTGTRFEPGDAKEFALDFALWKAQKPGEPAWPSPWGMGRPGWHIECSAMARRYLYSKEGGDRFDIHGGGVDLIFPHHENEIAQAEAAKHAPGPTFANIWMHNGMVQRDGEKMSKSLGNVVNVAEALDRWSPDAIRMYVLSSKYRQPNNLTDEAMAAAVAGIERLQRALSRDDKVANPQESIVIEHRQSDFIAAMEDDLGTPKALAVLFGLATAINQAADQSLEYRGMQVELRELAGVLGLTLVERATDEAAARLDPAPFAKLASRLDVVCSGKDVASTIDALVERRVAARTEKDWALADTIRKELDALGVTLEDGAAGTRWSVKR